MLYEIHIYALDKSLQGATHLSLPVSGVTRVDIYGQDTAKTTANHVISSIGVGLVGGVVLLFAIVAAACNCPQVYAYDGTQYQFKSGVFSGAIYSSIERTDYLPLDNLYDSNGKYLFRLMNTQEEEQYVNQLQLIKVAHSPSAHVLIDRNGALHSYNNPVAPIATSLKKDPAGMVLKARDGVDFIFDQKGDTTSDFASVVFDL